MRGEQELLTGTALAVFRLNGQFLDLAEELARPAGLTAAWWQVLGAVVAEPRPVPGIAREMGITRQSVQRIADLLVSRGLAEWLPNPAHRRSKRLRPTATGYAALQRIDPGHAAFAKRLADEVGSHELHTTLSALLRLSGALDALSETDGANEISAARGAGTL